MKKGFPLVSTRNADLKCSVRNKGLSNSEFLNRAREYLILENAIYETDERGNSSIPVALEEMEENAFYLFDADALLALTQTIEDLAMEEGGGTLLAAIQDGGLFEQHRDRYWQLGATLEDVQIISSGKLARTGSLKVCHDAKGLVKKFWMVLYEGRRFQALLLCEQSNKSEKFEGKKFVGFYTFKPRIILQAREDIGDALGGRCPDLTQFTRMQKIDRATKKLKVEFARETKAMDIAVKKLQSQEKKYHTKHFLADLNKTLERLNRLQTHLPEIIAGRPKND
ncbi:MAG: DICT sensory domain-containing protein [Verrucomicrobiota bacterium]